MSKTEVYRCDINKENYSQLNNKVNPYCTCNTTSMVQALDYMGYKLPTDIFKEFNQPEDKLSMFCITDERVLDYYAKVSPQYYKQWKEEKDSIAKEYPTKLLKDYKWKDSYAPNEVHAVLSYAVNLFMEEQCTEFKSLSIEEINNELKSCKPVVISVKFGNLNHVLTMTGIEITGNKIRYYVDDTYGTFNMETQKYDISHSGNDVIYNAEDLIACMKPFGQDKKYAHVFKFPAAVV